MPIVDGHRLRRSVREKADVCVVGTGAGGAVVAAILAAAGARVVVLEKGGFYTAEDFSQREEDMLGKIAGGRGLTTSTDGATTFTYGECIGGSTVHYWADTYPIPADRLRRWNERHDVEHTAESLAPSFARVSRVMHVTRAPESLMNENNRLVRQGMAALGWQDRGEVITQARRGCVGSGYCQHGCSYNAKMSTLITYMPMASRAGAVIYADAPVEEVVVAGGRVRGVRGHFFPRTGRRRALASFEVEAPRVVVAAGGIGTPLLLLRSRIRDKSGQIGKNLVVNPGYTLFGVFDRPLDNHRNPPCTYAIKGFREIVTDRTGGYVEGGWIALASHQYPGVHAVLTAGFGREHRERMLRYARLASLYSVVDDEETGEVGLAEDGTPRLTYTTRGRDVRKVQDFFAKCARVLLAAGAEEVWLPNGARTVVRTPEEADALAKLPVAPGDMLCAAPHLLGTCRMGRRPHHSVVDSWGSVHAVEGLTIADGSIMPTSMSVDPALTIMAIADAIGERLARRG
jgi:choline dehydrogenase-like flavoprotein